MNDQTVWIDLGEETAGKFQQLLFEEIIINNDFAALDLLASFRDMPIGRLAAFLAETKLDYLRNAPLALPPRRALKRSRSCRTGKSLVAVPVRSLHISDLARVISRHESEVLS